MLRRIPLIHTMNTRDLGGYPAEKGQMTQFGRFLRSDIPANLTEEETEWLRDKDITTVIDLRTDGECERTPCHFAELPGFDYRHYEIDIVMPGEEKDLPAIYLSIAQTSSMVSVMKAIAAAESGVLFHCTAGKDRTGVTAAILLLLAGVRQEDIVADYQVTYTYMQPMIRKLRSSYPDLPAWCGQSKPKYMEGFLVLLLAQYGSAAAFLLQAGLSETEVFSIKEKLLRP